MVYRVKIESFEGPFDLLLYLVSKQRVNIGSIAIAEIVDQYLLELDRIQNLDLEVASDFLLVASTLLEIKAASLLPREREALEEELETLSPYEAQRMLIDKLLTYKQYRNVAAYLNERASFEARSFARTAGLSPEFKSLIPDFLEGVTQDKLAALCVTLLARREGNLLDAEHIAAKPVPIEVYTKRIFERLKTSSNLRFSELIDESTPTPVIVVSFLALLELFKRRVVHLKQDAQFDDIVISRIEGAELKLDLLDESQG